MNIEQWCSIDESFLVLKTDEIYKKYAGLSYSNSVILYLENLRFINSKFFLRTYKEPKEFYLFVIDNLVHSSTKKLEIKLYDTRSKKIVSSKHRFRDNLVNWNNWRQYNAIAQDSNRKEVFDEFIKKTRYIAPIISKRFNRINDIYSIVKNNPGISIDTGIMNPLSCYLEHERITYSKLVEFISNLGNQCTKSFKRSLSNVSNDLLGRHAEYYDDFYFFRNIVYRDLEKIFSKVNPLNEVKRIMKTLKFDLNRIMFDSTDRQNKYPSPICFFVKIPFDIKILYKTESPYFDLQGCFHESGHAMHASSINPRIEYWKKYYIPMGIAEIFSILFERITKNNIFLKSLLKISSSTVISNLLEKLERRNKFMDLFFVTFYSANSLMKSDFWHKNLTLDETNILYSKLIKRFTGFEIPGEYWMLHHILPENIMYVPSYLLAAVRAKELDLILQNKFGEIWWTDEEAGKYLQDLMSDGSDIDLSIFSSLDGNLFLKEITTT